jgi:hypothetical protein
MEKMIHPLHDMEPEGRVERICPCGKHLGMHPRSARPTCGDEDCEDYLSDHPEWYDDEIYYEVPD